MKSNFVIEKDDVNQRAIDISIVNKLDEWYFEDKPIKEVQKKNLEGLYNNIEFLDDNMQKNQNLLKSVQNLLGNHAKNHYESFSKSSENIVEQHNRLETGQSKISQIKEFNKKSKETV